MKKSLKFLAVCGLFLSTYTFGQQLDLRAYGGVSITDFSNNTGIVPSSLWDEKISGMPGAQAGIKATIGHRLFVEPGIEWSLMALKVVNTNMSTDSTWQDESKLNMISVPLHVGVKLLDTEKQKLINLRLIGGVTGSHVLSVTHSKKSGLMDDYEKEDFKNLLMTLDGGLGLDIWIFYLEFQYKYGINHVFNASGNNATSSSMHINLGLKFTL